MLWDLYTELLVYTCNDLTKRTRVLFRFAVPLPRKSPSNASFDSLTEVHTVAPDDTLPHNLEQKQLLHLVAARKKPDDRPLKAAQQRDKHHHDKSVLKQLKCFVEDEVFVTRPPKPVLRKRRWDQRVFLEEMLMRCQHNRNSGVTTKDTVINDEKGVPNTVSINSVNWGT